MPATTFEAFVFDFDGTLVQSAAAKRQAYFDIFDPADAGVITDVLAANPLVSRHEIIPLIVAELEFSGGRPAQDAAALVAAYADLADTRVAQAPEVPGAGALLERLSHVAPAYVMSLTPHATLVAQLERRGWLGYLAGVFGYPDAKTAMVAAILARHAIPPRKLLVVGDGPSDQDAAEANGCSFHRIANLADLAEVAAFVPAAIHV